MLRRPACSPRALIRERSLPRSAGLGSGGDREHSLRVPERLRGQSPFSPRFEPRRIEGARPRGQYADERGERVHLKRDRVPQCSALYNGCNAGRRGRDCPTRFLPRAALRLCDPPGTAVEGRIVGSDSIRSALVPDPVPPAPTLGSRLRGLSVRFGEGAGLWIASHRAGIRYADSYRVPAFRSR